MLFFCKERAQFKAWHLIAITNKLRKEYQVLDLCSKVGIDTKFPTLLHCLVLDMSLTFDSALSTMFVPLCIWQLLGVCL